MVNEFKVGDQVAHDIFGNGEVVSFGEDELVDGWPIVKFNEGFEWMCSPDNLRPRNFLLKIAEEQEIREIQDWTPKSVNDPWEEFGQIPIGSKTVDQQFSEVFKDAAAHGTGVMKDGKHVPHSDVFNTDRFQRNAYGQLVDTVTGLPADSEGIVNISSIKDTARKISD